MHALLLHQTTGGPKTYPSPTLTSFFTNADQCSPPNDCCTHLINLAMRSCILHVMIGHATQVVRYGRKAQTRTEMKQRAVVGADVLVPVVAVRQLPPEMRTNVIQLHWRHDAPETEMRQLLLLQHGVPAHVIHCGRLNTKV
jgi:hypothetical protein